MASKLVDPIDLNLVRVLRMLLETRSVTRAGEALGLSQPATSRALARLRRTLGDPLLVRTSKGYVLTPLAASLVVPTAAALAATQALFTSARFDPDGAQRRFVIATTDYGAFTVYRALAAAIVHDAPQCSVTLVPWGEQTLADLESGAADLAFYADAPLPPDFHSRDLFTDEHVAVVRRGHPVLDTIAARPQETVAALASYPQIAMHYPSGREILTEDVLGRLGAPVRRAALTLPYFGTAPWMLDDSDLVITLPRRLAEPASQALQCALVPLPGPAARFTYRMIWHRRADRDGGVQWLRTLVSQRFTRAN